jgi:hypothetical protein
VSALELDHVLLAVTDLDEAGRTIEAGFGVRSVAGGRHPGFGTANRIVPLGSAYLELVAVADPVEAAASVFGRWVAGADAGRPMGWAVRTDDLDGVARRLGLAVSPGSRAAPDGRLLAWRTAGLERAAAEPLLPFFIEWGAGTPHPGGGLDGPGIERLVLTGAQGRLEEWLGGLPDGVEVRPGPPAVSAIVLAGRATQPIGCLENPPAP